MALFQPLLELTTHEKKWNAHYDTGGKRGVILRRYSGFTTLSTVVKQASIPFVTPRRCRIFGITWAGDVAGITVDIHTTTGERLTMGPTHIPALSGQCQTSRLTVSTFLAPYPSRTLTTFAGESPPGWNLILEPNFVLPGSKSLVFDYALENPTDTVPVPATPFLITQVLHVWEFPGFEGGAI